MTRTIKVTANYNLDDVGLQITPKEIVEELVADYFEQNEGFEDIKVEMIDEIDDKHDLISQAIESARCRIYRLRQKPSESWAHQTKAKNQEELMKITIEALQFYRDYFKE